MIRRPPRSTLDRSSAASDVYKRQGLDLRDHLDRFVDLAISGDAGECFECLTVIENQEIWPEKDARLALKKVSSAAKSETDAYKKAILEDLVKALEYRLGVE